MIKTYKRNAYAKAVQFEVGNMKEICSFLRGHIDLTAATDGTFLPITTRKGVEALRKGYWAVMSWDGLVNVYTDGYFKLTFKEVERGEGKDLHFRADNK